MRRSAFMMLGVGWLVLGGCQARGCSNLTPLPAGFSSAARVANATQLRVSSTGVAKLEAEPSLVAAQLLGGSLAFDVPASCGGSPATCCTGGVPVSPCGPLLFDVEPQAGDLPRLELAPVQSASRIDVTFRARIATGADVPVNIPSVGDCGMKIDTAPGITEDVTIAIPINLVQDATAGTTRLVTSGLTISGLTTDDVALSGGFACQAASFGLGSFLSTLTDAIADQLKSSLDASLCKACPSGDVTECGSFASACTDQVCMTGADCLQEIGVAGRLSSGALFAGASPGSTGTLDVHEIAGGYATTNSGGVALGVLAGMIPSGAARDRCGPSATAPVPASVPQSAYFQGNDRPDTAAPFDVALGLHATELEQFAYAAYEGGVLCPTVDTSALPTLTSAALDAAIPSLAKLTGGERPIAVGLRPQAPPTFVLGANTFDGSDQVVEPLVDLSFDAIEIDLFAYVEQQPIRVLTLLADVRVPIGVRIDDEGALVAVLGGAAGAADVSVKSSQALQESEAELEALAPRLLEPVLPELVRRLDLAELPTLLGMQLAFTSVTVVDSQSFVALFAELVPPPVVLSAAAATPAGSRSGSRVASIERLAELSRGVWADPLHLTFVALIGLALVFASRRRSRRWAVGAALGAIVVALPAACGDDDGGTAVAEDAGPDAEVDGGASGEGGRGGGGGGSDGGTAGADGGSAGVDGGGDGGTGGTGGTGADQPCGPQACEPGDVAHGELGQWSSVDTGSRTVVASYDAELGDLVLVELLDGDQQLRVIDGVPAETPTHEPDGYRGGIEQPGPDVGAWTSVRLDGSRVALAYQDRDRGALRAAFEDDDGDFHPHDVDDSKTAGVELGAYASLALGSTPSIAYLATGVPGSGGEQLTELRLASATTSTPMDESDWTTTVVASAVTDAPIAGDLPRGPGSFVNLLVLDDGRRVLVHYDHAQRALVAHVETSAGSESFGETVLDGGGALDRGRWASAVLDDDDLVHVAYEDSIGHQVLYLTFDPGVLFSNPEVVDDGTRASDRPHWVGAGLTLWLDGGEPRIAYQDAVTADVVLATKDGSWSHEDASTGSGATLDGFHLAAPAKGAGPLVWDRITPASSPSHELVVLEAP